MTGTSSCAAASPSPLAKRRSLGQSPSPATKRSRNSLLSPLQLLSVGGVEQLYRGVSVHGGTRLQVLGVYRYLADPALKERLGEDFADEVQCDVFDLLVSDGQHKMKVVLWPGMNSLVWKGELKTLGVISVKEFDVFDEDPEDRQRCQRVCMIRKLKVFDSEELQSEKIVSSHLTASGELTQLKFVSTVHPREVDLLPLAGERAYYLPLFSDDYTLDWNRSFDDGGADKDSPLEELEHDWAGRYLHPVVTDTDAIELNHELTSPKVTWDSSQEYCSSLFKGDCKDIYTLQQASAKTQQMHNGSSSHSPYPMVGVVQLKSKARHVGSPDVTNPFPFAFNIVLVDRLAAVEVAFFGSMCAKYFLRLQEGDLIQMRGYSMMDPCEFGTEFNPSDPLFCFRHDSVGSVFHVPAKYWKMLVLTRVLEPPLAFQGKTQLKTSLQTQRKKMPTPCWMACNFVTTLNTQYWSDDALENCETLYFDFVGVLSFVDKVCRDCKRSLVLDDGNVDRELLTGMQVTNYRWVKAIDSSSSQELVIRVEECSQPKAFHSLEAGSTFMATKLKWVVLPATDSDSRIQYAATSALSVLRLDDDVLPFKELKACSLNVYFAQNIKAKAVVEKRSSTGESKLDRLTKYYPRNYLPTSVDNFINAFGLGELTFSELSLLHDRIEIYEHQHVGFTGCLRYLYKDNIANRASIFLQLTENEDSTRPLDAMIAENLLYHRPALQNSTKTMASLDILPLLRVLHPAIVADLQAEATSIANLAMDSSEDESPSSLPKPELSVKTVADYFLVRSTELFFSLHLYRNGQAEVEWTVDAILPVSSRSGRR